MVLARWLPAAAALSLVTGCTADPRSPGAEPTPAPASSPSHTHAGSAGLPPAGDGTSRYEIGYTLRDVRLPARAGVPGNLSFVVENYRGLPQTEFLEELSKRMHVYVVRDDLAVFRHVHPEMEPDGTWRGNLTLPEPGDYRVVAEFTARDEGGDGDFVMLGDDAVVPGKWRRAQPAALEGRGASWGVEAAVVGDVPAGESQLELRLTTPGGSAPELGSYLGTSAHLTGFHVGTGQAVHMHPMGAPRSSAGSTALTFHAVLPTQGRYVLFLQVSVEGFVHTLPLALTTA